MGAVLFTNVICWTGRSSFDKNNSRFSAQSKGNRQISRKTISGRTIDPVGLNLSRFLIGDRPIKLFHLSKWDAKSDSCSFVVIEWTSESATFQLSFVKRQIGRPSRDCLVFSNLTFASSQKIMTVTIWNPLFCEDFDCTNRCSAPMRVLLSSKPLYCLNNSVLAPIYGPFAIFPGQSRDLFCWIAFFSAENDYNIFNFTPLSRDSSEF